MMLLRIHVGVLVLQRLMVAQDMSDSVVSVIDHDEKDGLTVRWSTRLPRNRLVLP